MIKSPFQNKRNILFQALLLISFACFSQENSPEKLFKQAKTWQYEGQYHQAIETFKNCLLQAPNEDKLSQQQVALYADALLQTMNCFQSLGQAETCIDYLQALYKEVPIFQKKCLRDYYSVMGYALSRTEKMKQAEDITLKVFTLPLRHESPERYFRDYAFAAAVFYSNPHYQNEVIEWCEEALRQAQLCKNTSGEQWVSAMLGNLYKRNGRLNQALELFLQSKDEAQAKHDDLGVLNSLHALIDLFLYWDVPEYANLCASQAIEAESNMSVKNPGISAQTFINKGRALQQLGEKDSILYYTEKARALCQTLPYNSGMVDVDLLHGSYLTDLGGDSLQMGIQKLQQVATQGTVTNRAKAYHQLAQCYLKNRQHKLAETMLDSMYALLSVEASPIHIHINHEPIINHYLKTKQHEKAEQHIALMLHEQQTLKEKRLNFNLVEAIVEQQTEQKRQELKIVQLEKSNQRLWFLIYVCLSLALIALIVVFLLHQRKQHKLQMKQADEKLDILQLQLQQSNAEKELISQEFDDIMNNKDHRQELESLTPSVLQESGESKFRQRFELLYPLFLPRLRECVPSITRREELLSMLIVLKQDNKAIAELLAIAPRSVLMLRHRFRQKIGLSAEVSLESFIENCLKPSNNN
ncbi:MAG: hypothetical protein IIX13_01145 [Bacteroidales bacterium]|nr:hypothetical protein [Bacteroidales bacterium]